MSKSPKVSIVILNYNAGKVLIDCLNSVLKTIYPNFEIILIDNASKLDEYENIKNRFSNKIELFRNKKNLGYAGGNNVGVKRATGEYLVFLNNDTVVSPHWLDNAIKRLQQDQKIAFLQPKIKWLKNKKYFEYAGGAGGYLDYFGFPFARGRLFGSLEEDIGQYNDEKEIFWASGVCFFCRKNTFKKLGGFDTFFFAYAEENDLCFRALRSGYKNIYLPGNTVYHYGGYTSNKNIFKKIFLIHRNHLVMLIKNLKFSELLIVLPPRLFMDLAATLYYLFGLRSPEAAYGVIVGYFSLFIHFPEILRSRYYQKNITFGYPENTSLVYRGSIAWQYYFAKKSRWCEIMKGNTCPSKTQKIF